MARPEIDFREQVIGKKDHRGIVRAIHELSIYPIHRAYMDVKTKTADYTIDPLLDRVILVDASGGSVTISLPDAADADTVEYVIVAIVTGNDVVVDTVGSANINGSSSVTTSTQYVSIRVVSDGTNYFRTDVFS